MRGNELATSALAAGDHNRASDNRRPTGNKGGLGRWVYYVVLEVVTGRERRRRMDATRCEEVESKVCTIRTYFSYVAGFYSSST